MDRRRLLVISLAGAVAAPLVDSAHAQPPKGIPRIGVLWESTMAPRAEAFRQGLRELGYKEGQDIVIETRTAEGRLGGLSERVGIANVHGLKLEH